MGNIEAEQSVIHVVITIASKAAESEVGPETDLIAAGVDSITIVELAGRLGDALGVTCTIDDVFESPTLGTLATLLERRIDASGAR